MTEAEAAVLEAARRYADALRKNMTDPAARPDLGALKDRLIDAAAELIPEDVWLEILEARWAERAARKRAAP